MSYLTQDSTYNPMAQAASWGDVKAPNTSKLPINLSDKDRTNSNIAGGALAAFGILRGGFWGWSLAALGGALLFRGSTGHCPVNQAMGRDTASDKEKDMSITLEGSTIINKSVDEVYAYWRKLENLPKFMTWLKEVKELDEKHSEWWAHIPGDIIKIRWQAEIVEDRKNELISYESLPGADIDNAGSIRFEALPNGSRTIVHSTITYRPPAGVIGAGVAKMFNPLFQEAVKGDMDRFKKVLEAETPEAQQKKQEAQPMEA